ncbi:serine/threonine-protein kinase mTOR [Parasteatoda tepidariorum]|nr:serine/threonine-protein kinase mTOR [Parasteatoda tepidariorum]
MASSLQVFVSGLKSKNEDVRLKTTRELHHYITTELREMSIEDVTTFLDEFNHHIFEMVSSSDVNDKKGGILAIVNLLGINVGNTGTRTSRFVNYLRNLLPSSDIGVMELAAYAIGRLALASGTYTAEYVEFEAKRAFEWLSGDRHEAKRHAAVLVLRELAVSTPTFFFQQVPQFFECIFNAHKDPKPQIRESAAAALRAALVVRAQRETKEVTPPLCYSLSYDVAAKGLEEALKEKGVARDDKIHGSLLVLNELLRCSNLDGEMTRQELEDKIQQQASHESGQNRYNFLKELGTGSLSRSFKAFHQLHQNTQNGSHKGAGLSAVVKYHKALGTYPGDVVSTRRIQVYESNACKQLIAEHFDTICQQVLRYRNSKSIYIQQTLLNIIPRLAAFSTEKFAKSYLNETMIHLLSCLRRERERYNAFNAVGLLAVAVKLHINPFIPKIMEVIRSSLPSKDVVIRKKPPPIEPAVFTCISMLARAVGHNIMSDIKELLEPMMATGLSPSLTASLRELATEIPQLKKDIQEGLLKMLSVVLMRRTLRHPGMPKHLSSLPPSSSLHQSLLEVNDAASLTLALKTLGSFDFQGRPLMLFVRYCAENYLSSENKEIRLEAVRTCCKLLSPAVDSMKASGRYSSSLTATVQEVLAKLLMVGVTDSDMNVRYSVLASLDDKFDSYLAQADNLNALFIALNDEMFEIRELALCTVGRLSAANPAYIMPSLRKVLIQILTELEHSGIGRNKEQSAKMLGHLGANAPRLIRPYMEPVLNVLIPKLRDPDPNPGVTVSILAAIGEQAQVSGVEMRKWLDQLMPILLDMMQDSSSLPKREVALWTLGQLIESTGYVIEPYMKYPNLLELLLNFLKTEQSPTIRREAIRVLGLLGALDPFKYKVTLGLIDLSGESSSGMLSIGNSTNIADNQEMSASEMLVNMSGSLDEFYPQIAIVTLMKIIREPLLHQHHSMAVHAITFLFKNMGISAVPYLPQVMPSFINVIKTADNPFREFLFQQLCQIISIVKIHIRNYLDDIFCLLKDFWTPQSPMQSTILLLIEQVVIALGAEFKIYLPQLIPHFLRVFMHDTSENRTITMKLLIALQKFGNNLDDYLHLILPPVVKLFDSPDVPINVQRHALETIDHLSETLDFTEFSSRILQPLVRNLDTVPELRPTAMDTLCSVVIQLGKKYQIYIPMVHKVLTKHRINHQRYDVLISRIIKGTAVEENDDPLMYPKRKTSAKSHENDISQANSEVGNPRRKLQINIANLQRAWASARRVSKDDWLEWLKRMSVVLLKESPSPALRSCCALAESYDQLPRDMFNAIFLSCWSELHEKQQNELAESLQQALTTQNIPEITQTLLNLAEFMEHCEKGLPESTLKSTLLGEKAMECRAYAKALHYKEDEFHKGPTTEILEALIGINNKLHQPEAAAGVLEYAMKNHDAELKVKELWYEKLHKWDKALIAYQKAREQKPDDIELIMGQMKCLEVLGEWGQLYQLSSETWPTADTAFKTKMAPMSAAAAWGLGHWESMEEYTKVIPRGTTDSAFYQAILSIHRSDFYAAQQFIDKARDLLDTELTALAGESYSRAYGAMVHVQMMSELEEVIQYKLIPERRDHIKQKWWDRLQGCQRIVEDWQKIMQVHSLVVSPQEDMRSWLKYASLCRKAGRLALSHRTLVMLLGSDPSTNSQNMLPCNHPQVTFAYIKHMWKSNQKQNAFKHLQTFVNISLASQEYKNTMTNGNPPTEITKLLSKCYLKLGEWEENLHGINETSIPQILQFYSLAMDKNRDWYKVAHAWALMNFHSVLFFQKKEQQKQQLALGDTIDMQQEHPSLGSIKIASSAEYIRMYAVPAVRGFFHSIALSNGNSLQDTLRLSTLWFDYGHILEVNKAVIEGLKTIPVETWLQVIPQLIARIDTPRQLVGEVIHQLLMDIGKHHPQALIYPLTVAAKSTTPSRNNAANKILDSMMKHSGNLVEQAKMVSEELIRVAILWHELWHEGLEEASRLYFGERNIKGMFAALEPLHALIEKGPQTLKETSFTQAYGRELADAQEYCKKYQRTGNVKELTQAWDTYYHVFRRVAKQLPQLTSLELQYVSPKLLMCRDLELAVPGSYNPNKPIIRIAKVESALQVITSKQRPRKLTIKGSNGKDFTFLLKGHEDLRQDERVMQLFGLVNTLLTKDPETSRRNITIHRYSVIPLSTNSGLIGWVPHCDTLHTLIRDYREKKKILLNIEHRIMLRMAPDYDHLTLMQKVEVFEHALKNTQGDDLAKLLWLKSPSSEVWFDRRTNYTRSLAVMSMVGYVLGLGDRHPSNLMLDRLSGKILHIDFGDCFEVAMTRDKFPEKIPFRLTRMLIHAMEVTGIEGTYRKTCQKVMKVLRDNKDSLMAVLEAFVYDPLLNWRLIDAQPKGKHSKSRSESSSSIHDQNDILEVEVQSQADSKKTDTPIDSWYNKPEALNEKAVQIINRVQDKLTGRDFDPGRILEIDEQVDLLIRQATSHENLCQSYIGWCPFW